LAKIGKHIDGTSGAKRGCNTDWTLAILCIKMLALQGGMELKLNVEKFIKSVEMNEKYSS
jgi:hypothetical protein